MIDCQLRKGDSCQLVSELARVPIELAIVTNDACLQCQKQSNAKSVNYVTISLSISVLHKNGLLERDKHRYLTNAVQSKNGPGKMLSQSLAWIAKPDEGDCYCQSRAAIMDLWGPEKCDEEIETIVEWLMEGAEKHNVSWVPKPLQRTVAKALIRDAINKSRNYANTVHASVRNQSSI